MLARESHWESLGAFRMSRKLSVLGSPSHEAHRAAGSVWSFAKFLASLAARNVLLFFRFRKAVLLRSWGRKIAPNLARGVVCAHRLDTEIPILPQSPSPPPQQRSSLSGQSQQASSLLASTLQPSQQHRPLLHGLLSGTHLPQGPYHRGYSTSSTG
ncbi:AGAP007327-PA-like protein [Anopheles sinensis]|uniref:AGAP007327-PA-like protein n=1 Tax=Anopheles sinensis TaxID=74873 RepID=A0A084WS48_ANOSI|nr:AGAP007327-PA-like protein [Anopheles sinensis]